MKLVLIEDDPVFREKLGILLGGEEGMEVIAIYGDVASAKRHPSTDAPDFFIVDLGLPGSPGIEFIRWARSALPNAETVALTSDDEVESCLAVIRAGASGYVLKSGNANALVAEIRDVLNGGHPISPRMARLILRETQKAGEPGENALSEREIQVLKGLSREMSYKELAAELNLSFHTVNNHIKSIYRKLWVTGKDEALNKAKNLGII